MAELEAVKKSSRKASRSWSNADEKKRGKNNGNENNGQRDRGKNGERKKRGNLSVSDKMSLLKLKMNWLWLSHFQKKFKIPDGVAFAGPNLVSIYSHHTFRHSVLNQHWMNKDKGTTRIAFSLTFTLPTGHLCFEVWIFWQNGGGGQNQMIRSWLEWNAGEQCQQIAFSATDIISRGHFAMLWQNNMERI